MRAAAGIEFAGCACSPGKARHGLAAGRSGGGARAQGAEDARAPRPEFPGRVDGSGVSVTGRDGAEANPGRHVHGERCRTAVGELLARPCPRRHGSEMSTPSAPAAPSPQAQARPFRSNAAAWSDPADTATNAAPGLLRPQPQMRPEKSRAKEKSVPLETDVKVTPAGAASSKRCANLPGRRRRAQSEAGPISRRTSGGSGVTAW